MLKLMSMKGWVLCAALLLSATDSMAEEPFEVTVEDEVLATVGPDFYGLHYDGPSHKTWDDVHKREVSLPGMFGSPSARRDLEAIGTRVARIFIRCQEAHPEPGVFDWAFLDAAVGQVVESGMAPMLCLHQGGALWFVGTKEEPWWQHDNAMVEWRAFAEACAKRYGERVRYYEILNEPNHIDEDQANYMGWARTVDCFIDAAKVIKASDPDGLCGGAATWAAWESATWAGHVLERAEGERLLDFVSYHIYTSHDLADSDAAILAKAAWFEESPRYIRAQLAERTQKPILTALTEFNTSAVWSKEGKPYTDPRNVNAFGGLVSALAYLHSARGGCDMAMHFATAGGFGLLVWPPRYERQPAYYAVLLLHDVAGLIPGAKMLAVTTSEEPKKIASAVRAELFAHDLEPFAIRGERHLAVVLVNKRRDATLHAKVDPGDEWLTQSPQLFRYTSVRIPGAVYPVLDGTRTGPDTTVECPSYSVNVLRFAPATPE